MRVGQIYRDKMKKAVTSAFEAKGSTFVVTYTGITSAQMNDIRKSLKRKKADVYVTKSTVARLALKDVKLDALAQHIVGQMAFVFTDTDISEVSKELLKVAKENQGFTVAGGYQDGNTLSAADVKRLSDLPTRDVLLSQLLSTIQAPVSRLAGAINAKSRELLSILKQLSEKKGGTKDV